MNNICSQIQYVQCQGSSTGQGYMVICYFNGLVNIVCENKLNLFTNRKLWTILKFKKKCSRSRSSEDLVLNNIMCEYKQNLLTRFGNIFVVKRRRRRRHPGDINSSIFLFETAKLKHQIFLPMLLVQGLFLELRCAKELHQITA